MRPNTEKLSVAQRTTPIHDKSSIGKRRKRLTNCTAFVASSSKCCAHLLDRKLHPHSFDETIWPKSGRQSASKKRLFDHAFQFGLITFDSFLSPSEVVTTSTDVDGVRRAIVFHQLWWKIKKLEALFVHFWSYMYDREEFVPPNGIANRTQHERHLLLNLVGIYMSFVMAFCAAWRSHKDAKDHECFCRLGCVSALQHPIKAPNRGSTCR